jgi:outer membrane protein OmpA-like peptidoglycan-associated protein
MQCGLISKSAATMGLSVVMFLGLSGCQDKVADENKSLWQQNRELEAQNEKLQMQQTAMPAAAPQQPLAPVAPAPAPVAPAPVVADPPAAPVAPAPVHQIGGMETTVDVRAGTTTVHLPSDVFFDSGSAILRSPGKSSLIKVASDLKHKYAGKSIEVEGYTDSDPIKYSKWKSNKALSEARAKAVRDFLVSQGISADKLSTHGMGDADPRSTKVKSLNRRVEIVVAAVR